MKDLFSKQADLYAQFRPDYPDELFASIYEYVNNYHLAWDCATGNGQVARVLGNSFEEVIATDISKKQLAEAASKKNITYRVAPAENSAIEAHSCNLITVGQALHWFNFDAFFDEVRRVGMPDSLLAVFGYGLNTISDEVDALLWSYYQDVVGPYWDEERRHIEDKYTQIVFPFREVSNKEFSIRKSWKPYHFEGYLNTWSSTQKFIQSRGYNPIESVMKDIEKVWPSSEEKEVSFPIFSRLFMVNES